MKDLESKGINWTGNIYNDTTIQDTFKYVENHVQNVGGSFKRFCSNVVQDFFPLSADPVRHNAALEEDTGVGTDGCSDSEMSVTETSSDSAVKKSPVRTVVIDDTEKRVGVVSTGDDSTDEPKNAKSTESHEIPDSVLLPAKTNVLMINENSDLSGNDVNDSKESADGPLELPSPGVTGSFEASSLDELINISHEYKSVVSPSVGLEFSARALETERPSSEGAFCNVHSDDSECDFCAPSSHSETSFAVVSGEDAVTGGEPVPSGSSPVRDSISLSGYSSDISTPGAMYSHTSADVTGCGADSPNRLLSPTPASAMSTKVGAAEKQLVSSISHLSLESIDDSEVDVAADSGMETINLDDEVKLGESCVFVDDTVLYDVSRRARKLGSYKKKIRDIFASKNRLAKEYEQLAIWYGDTDTESSPDAQNLQARQSCDSEWELL